MANNNKYTWQFPAIDVYKNQGGYTDVVYNIHWRLAGVDQSTSYSAEVYGVQSVAPYNPDSGSFVPFENLTKEVVTGWVRDAMKNVPSGSVDRYGQLTSSIDSEIQSQISPSVEQLPPPW